MMFVVFLEFSKNKARAAEYMAAHQAWIRRGIDDAAFLLVASLPPQRGGAILAHGMSRPDLEARVNEDPFVQHDVVHAEIIELSPNLADERLRFVLS